jgi:hypothetical protein
MPSPTPISRGRRESGHPTSLPHGPADGLGPIHGRAPLGAPADVRALPEVYTLDEAAALLRVRRSWLERQAAARKIPFTLLGGAYHFTSMHLQAIVRRHEVVPAADGGRDEQASDSPRRLRSRPGPQTPGAAPLQPRPRIGPRRAA